MGKWSFLTNHARVLVCIADDPGVRLRDIAATLGITERTAFGIVTDLTEAGYVVKDKQGRRNRYRIQDHLPLQMEIGREPTIGEVLGVLIDTTAAESAQPQRASPDLTTGTDSLVGDGLPVREHFAEPTGVDVVDEPPDRNVLRDPWV